MLLTLIGSITTARQTSFLRLYYFKRYINNRVQQRYRRPYKHPYRWRYERKFIRAIPEFESRTNVMRVDNETTGPHWRPDVDLSGIITEGRWILTSTCTAMGPTADFYVTILSRLKHCALVTQWNNCCMLWRPLLHASQDWESWEWESLIPILTLRCVKNCLPNHSITGGGA